MAEETLVAPSVAAAQRLTRLLDEAGYAPRAVLWAYTSDAESWRLWVVPPADLADKRDFYLVVAGIFADYSAELQGMRLGDVLHVGPDHPVIRGLDGFGAARDIGEMRISHNMLNGYFLPAAVVVRLAA